MIIYKNVILELGKKIHKTALYKKYRLEDTQICIFMPVVPETDEMNSLTEVLGRC